MAIVPNITGSPIRATVLQLGVRHGMTNNNGMFSVINESDWWLFEVWFDSSTRMYSVMALVEVVQLMGG